MKRIYKFATLTLMLFAVSVYGFSRKATRETPLTATQNLVRGVVGPVGGDPSWANYSLLNIIPGSALFPITSPTTVFYFGFTAGSMADISNMVLYTTPRGSLAISAVTPVTLGGISNPSINLASTAVCPVQPLSTTNPCIVRFDPTTITLAAANDYYLMVFFTNDSNNQAISATQPSSIQSSLGSSFFGGTDYTHLTVGQSLPGTATRAPNFLMYVMTN